MKKLLAVSVLAALTTTQASAVSLGTDVDESDYRDYIVRFETQDSDGATSTCGGLLVSGEYIVTAAHCVGESYNPGNGVSNAYAWEIDQGASNAISVYQGVKYNANKKIETSYSIVNFLDRDNTEDEAYAEVDQVIAENPTFSISRDAEDWTKGAFQYDIAVLKLNSKLDQSNNAAMLQSYTSTTDTWNVNNGDSFTFRGWGLDENGATPDTMQQTDIYIDYSHEDMASADYVPRVVRESDNSSCTGDNNCTYGIFDFITLLPSKPESVPQSGDSGTPLEIKPNSIYAIAKRTAFDNKWVQFTHLSWYLSDIANAINKVTAPTGVTFAYNENQIDTKSHTFAVQNLTSLDENINPYIVNDNGEFDVKGCENTVLKPLESCEITVTVNDGAEQTDTSLALADTNDTQITISYTKVAEAGNGGGDGSTDGDDSDELDNIDSSGGGSFGILSLLILAGLGLKRCQSRQ
ncbi:hypothetical protein BZJ17_06805 [Salinivibrio sp. IB574]|uniref:trypsin-like serine protease n=1 Tax=Salinivibrio sp. IB574 TaxID=1909444 RepID=UPI0009CD082D|nr:trypsin-like serine protease [Salinivibrio sp. IB574]OOF22240.1 hypothetical protein BZJ17_06805 [Salinivibrio sp. IB574]